MRFALVPGAMAIAAVSTQIFAQRTSTRTVPAGPGSHLTVPIGAVSPRSSARMKGMRTAVTGVADGTPSLGQGYDIFTGRLLAKDCAAIQNSTDEVVADPNGVIDGGFFGEMRSLSDVQQSSGLSGSASLTYEGFTIGASGGLQNGTSFNGYNRYARVLVPVLRERKGISPRALGVNGSAAIGDVKRFYESCGRMYVSAIHYGSKLDATLSVLTKTQTSTSKNQEGVSLGLTGLFSVGVDHQQASATVNQHGSMTMAVTDRGGLGPIPDEATLVDYGHAYPSKFPAARGIIAIELSPYREIVTDHRTARLDRVLEDKLQALSFLVDKRNLSRLRLNQLLFAQANPALVTGAPSTAADLTAAVSALQTYLQSIADAVSKCQTDTALDTCKVRVQSIGDVPATSVALVPDA